MSEKDWREWFKDDLQAMTERRKELEREIESLQRDALALDDAIWQVQNTRPDTEQASA